MKHLFYTAFLCACSILLTAQSPTLISDFNPGEEDGFNRFNYSSINFNERLIFPVVSAEFGEELGVVFNEELSLLKDISPGQSSSEPEHFTELGGIVYFTTYSEDNGAQIWSTDGTESGTQLVFTLGSFSFEKIQGFIKAKSDFIYYTYNQELYKTNGIINEKILSDVEFYSAYQQLSGNYCTYKNEIAFAVVASNKILIYKYENNEITLMTSIEEASSFASVFGLNETQEGVIFGVDDSFNDDAEGTYTFNSTSADLTKFAINGKDAVRIHNFTDNSCIAFFLNDGYYNLNGVINEEAKLTSSSETFVTQGIGIVHGIYEDKMLFYAGESFGDDKLVYTDGTSSGSSVILNPDPYPSNILVKENLAFFAGGTSNNFKPELYVVNMIDGSYNLIHAYDIGSVNIRSVLLLGVLDQRLYYISNLDATIGRELYSIDFSPPVSTKNYEELNVEVITYETYFEIQSDAQFPIDIEFYSIDGRLLKSENVVTNTVNELPSFNGAGVIKFWNGNQLIVHKFVRLN